MPWTPIPSFRPDAPPHTAAEWNALIDNANFFFDLAGLEQTSSACIMRRDGVVIAYLVTPAGTTVTVPLPEPPAPGRAVGGFVQFFFGAIWSAFCVIRGGTAGTSSQIMPPSNITVSISASGALTLSHPTLNMQCAGWFIIQTQ